MKSKTIVLSSSAAAVLGSSLILGAMAHADDRELERFLDKHPNLAEAISELESLSGGSVTEAELDDGSGERGQLVEAEVELGNGSQDWVYDVELGEWRQDDRDLERFLDNHRNLDEAFSELESLSGGTVTDAEYDDDNAERKRVEAEVVLGDGSDQDWVYDVDLGEWQEDLR